MVKQLFSRPQPKVEAKSEVSERAHRRVSSLAYNDVMAFLDTTLSEASKTFDAVRHAPSIEERDAQLEEFYVATVTLEALAARLRPEGVDAA